MLPKKASSSRFVNDQLLVYQDIVDENPVPFSAHLLRFLLVPMSAHLHHNRASESDIPTSPVSIANQELVLPRIPHGPQIQYKVVAAVSDLTRLIHYKFLGEKHERLGVPSWM